MNALKALLLTLAAATIVVATGCDVQPRKSDAELGLSPTQAAGRHLFDRHCGMCHEAYSSRPRKGPSLEGMFKRPYLKMGAPANNDRVEQIIEIGRAKMPGFSRTLSQQQVDDLIAYLHTL
jgi:mono/diheme cytochrome c family protein